MKKIIVFLLIISLLVGGYMIFLSGGNSKNDDKKNTTKVTTTETKNEDNSKSLKLTFVGDLLFESPFYKAIDNGYDKNNYFKNVKKYFLDDDISVGNMEVVIGNSSLSVSGDGYNFCAPSYIGDLVSTLDFEILSLANNHSNDRGMDGLNSTIDYFNKTKIKTVGTYKNNEDRKNYRIIEKNGIKIGFLSYTLGTNIPVDKNNRLKIGLYRDPDTKTVTNEYKELIKNEVNEIKEKTDIQIVMMHWGNEFTFTPNQEQKDMAKYLNELGVDIIYGSHSHSMQPIEIIGDEEKTLVYYSLGNFTSHDDDIARTPKGQETFDNAYQIGLLSKINLTYKDGKINFDKIKTIPIVNYFDKGMNNFELIPFEDYNETYEKNHFRYNLGLNKEFIKNTFNSTIKEDFR